MVTVFCQQLFERVDFQIAFSEQPLEPGILFLELLETLNLVNRHPAIGLAPAVERVLGDAMCATDGSDSLLAFLRLFQDFDDLFGGMLIRFHFVLL